jgi:hypothetical protein
MNRAFVLATAAIAVVSLTGAASAKGKIVKAPVAAVAAPAEVARGPPALPLTESGLRWLAAVRAARPPHEAPHRPSGSSQMQWPGAAVLEMEKPMEEPR